MSFCPVYIPVGVPTFHLESAQDQFERSIRLLRGLDVWLGFDWLTGFHLVSGSCLEKVLKKYDMIT